MLRPIDQKLSCESHESLFATTKHSKTFRLLFPTLMCWSGQIIPVNPLCSAHSVCSRKGYEKRILEEQNLSRYRRGIAGRTVLICAMFPYRSKMFSITTMRVNPH